MASSRRSQLLASTATFALALSFLAPGVRAHAAPFGDFSFGSNGDGNANLAEPLTEASGPGFFFRGLTPDSARSTVTLQPGGTFNYKVGCSKSNAEDGSNNVCNSATDGALHLRPDGSGSGCGLSISYKPFDQIRPADMITISVSHDCVKPTKDHSFRIPDNLPAGEATCAWSWIPPASSSANEMYHTGLACRVGGNNGGTLTDGPESLYFAVSGFGSGGNRPQYREAFSDGPQQLTVSGGSATGNAGDNNGGNNANLGVQVDSPSSQEGDNQSSDNQSNGNAPQSSNNNQSNGNGNGNGKQSGSSGRRCKSGGTRRSKRHQHRRHHAGSFVEAGSH